MGFIEIQTLVLLGILLSVYTLNVERHLAKSKKRKPLCDIHKRASCSKAFTSKYGHLLGKSNAFYGFIFYTIVFILLHVGALWPIFYLSLLASIGSVYLMYISFIKLKNYCVVCIAVYVVNFLLLVVSYNMVW